MINLGVDYYPEHWSESMMSSDMDRIVEMGANTVRIGEFAWHMMESSEGQYDFSFFDKVIEELKMRGLKVIFGTPTATFPAWLAAKYPEILSVDYNGVKRAFGGRRQYCYNSPTYREKSLAITRALLEHYRDEDAIIAWQIDNELGHEGSDQCYCEICHKGFQTYLQKSYVTIDNLNQVYGTIFWGQTYNSFDEIPMPTQTITTHNPTLQLDWARFRSESINDYAGIQIEVVQALKRVNQKVIHNLFGGFFDRAYDQNVLAEKLDVVAYDNYPVWGGLETPLKGAEIAMTHDYIRGLKGQNFWIVEELMGAQGHDVIGYLPRPNQAKLWSHQAMARGCESLLYFRWRGMTHGAEQFCQGILDQDNEINDKYREVQSFFESVKKMDGVYQSEIKAEVAVLYDYDNRWSWKAQTQSHAFDFTHELMRCYEGFYRHNVSIDVVDIEKPWSAYKVIILPVMQIVDEATLLRIQTFAEAGGTVLFSFRSGIKNRDNNLRLGRNSLETLCGVLFRSYESLGKATKVSLRASANCGITEDTASGSVWRDMMEVVSAKAIYNYTDEPFDSYAAVTVNNYGAGRVYYMGTGLNSEAVKALSGAILEEAGIRTHETLDGVEMVERMYEGRIYRFLLNHTGTSVNQDGIVLEPYDCIVVDGDTGKIL